MVVKPPLVTGYTCPQCGNWHIGTYEDFLAKKHIESKKKTISKKK